MIQSNFLTIILIYLALLFIATLTLVIPRQGSKISFCFLFLGYVIYIFFSLNQTQYSLTTYFNLNNFGILFTIITSIFCLNVTVLNGMGNITQVRGSLLTGYMFLAHIFLIGASEFMTFFVALEMIGLISYALVSISNLEFSKEASVKYFIQGSLISVVFLFAMALFFGATGSFSFKEIEVKNHMLYSISLVFFLIVTCFKLGVFPFHSWMPDVYTNVSRGVLANNFLVNKFIVGFSMVTLVQFLLFEADVKIQEIVIQTILFLSIVSAFYGNIMGVAQKQFKSMIAYSSLAHAGYILMALPLRVGQKYEIQLLFYLGIYSIAATGALLIINYFQRNGEVYDVYSSLKGAFYKNQTLGFLLTVFVLSLAGIPLTGGFTSKYLLFTNFFKENFTWTAFSILLSSIIGLAYYIKIIIAIFMEEEEITSLNAVHESSFTSSYETNMKLIVVLLGIIILLSGLYPTLFFKILS